MLEHTNRPMGRPKVEFMLSEAEQSQLASMARSRSIPAARAFFAAPARFSTVHKADSA